MYCIRGINIIQMHTCVFWLINNGYDMTFHENPGIIMVYWLQICYYYFKNSKNIYNQSLRH